MMDPSRQRLPCVSTRQILPKCHEQNKCQVCVTLTSRLVLNPWWCISEVAVMNIPAVEREVTSHKYAMSSEP